MAKVSVTHTGASREKIHLAVGVRDGAVMTESLAPGETKDIDIDLDSAVIKGQMQSGLISVKDGRNRKVEASSDTE